MLESRYCCSNLFLQPHLLTSDAATPSLSYFDTTTTGAFAAHALKFKSGGVKSVMKAYEKQLRDFPKEKNALLNDVEDLQLTVQHRKEMVFSQALGACITSFISSLLRCMAHPVILERYVKGGFLFQVESLLSTFREENGMLDDHDFAIYWCDLACGHVCACVCMCVCMCVWMDGCVYVCVYACMYECMDVCMNVWMCVFMHVCMCVSVCVYACLLRPCRCCVGGHYFLLHS